eukprot:m.160649 g.160649  ORF g.160649 m.160649 type:complete len:456 (-) comp31192_c0_seq5:314-1681(-)
MNQRRGCTVAGVIFVGWLLYATSTRSTRNTLLQTKVIQPLPLLLSTPNVNQDHNVHQVAWQHLSQTLNVQNPNLTKFVQAWEQGFSFEIKTAINNAGLQNTIAKLPSHLVYPSGGGDFYSLYAINPHASGYFILARDLVFPAQHDWHSLLHLLQHNQTFVEAAGRSLTTLIGNSNLGGFQFGFALETFSSRYGMVMMLLAVLGSIPTIAIKTVTPITVKGLRGVTFACSRPVPDGSATPANSEFQVHFLQLDLHDKAAVANVAKSLHTVWDVQRVVTVVKGAEGTFWPQQITRAGLSSLNNSRIDEILEEQNHHNRGVAFLTDTFLNISDVIIQDYTGLSFRSLMRWSDGVDHHNIPEPLGNIHVFGAYLEEQGMNEDQLAMARYFEHAHTSSSRALHSLGKLRYGYCKYVLSKEIKELVQSRNVYLDHVDAYGTESTSLGLFCHLVVACKHDCR